MRYFFLIAITLLLDKSYASNSYDDSYQITGSYVHYDNLNSDKEFHYYDDYKQIALYPIEMNKVYNYILGSKWPVGNIGQFTISEKKDHSGYDVEVNIYDNISIDCIIDFKETGQIVREMIEIDDYKMSGTYTPMTEAFSILFNGRDDLFTRVYLVPEIPKKIYRGLNKEQATIAIENFLKTGVNNVHLINPTTNQTLLILKMKYKDQSEY